VPPFSKLFDWLRAKGKPAALAEPLYPEATTELEVLSRLVAEPALFETFNAFGLDQSDLPSVLSTQVIQDGAKSEKALRRVRAGALAASSGAVGTLSAKCLPQEDLLAFLITLGSDEIRRIAEHLRLAPGPVIFWLAHREHEVGLRATWPTAFPSGARVAVVNDSYSPMEVVLHCLIEAFELSRERAVELMLRIHHEGVVHLDIPSNVPVVEFCSDSNQRWRSIPIPLYVRPVAV
jgi:hypothetical protein